MNMNKYIIIIAVALFAAAAISAFGAESGGNTSADAGTAVAGADLNDAVARLKNPSRAAAVGAARDIAGMHTEEAARALISYLKTSKDDYMKIQVIEILAVEPSSATTRALIESARNPNPYVRQAAIRSLGFRTDGESLPELKRVLSQDSDIGVRKFAVQALSIHTSAAAAETADNVLADNRNSRELRVMAARALKKMNTPGARTKLNKYKNDNDIAVKNEINRSQGVDQTKQ
jgi:HEAT repeat protein